MENSLDDALRSLAVAIGIDSVAHGIVSGLVGQEPLRFGIDDILVRADEAYRAGFDGFRPFGRIAQDQDRLAGRDGASSWMPPESVRTRSPVPGS